MPKPKRRGPIVPVPKVSGTERTNRATSKKAIESKGQAAQGKREKLLGGRTGKRPRTEEGNGAALRAAKRAKRTGDGAAPHRHGVGSGHWRPISTVHQQSAFAVQRLLEADSSRKRGASLKSLTLAPHVVAKKATYAVTCQVLKFSRLLEQLDERAQLSANQPKLNRFVAMVLVYELLRGQGLERKGQAERAVLAAEPRLRAALEELLQEAGVQSLDELLEQQQADAGAGAAGGAAGSGGAGGPAVPHPRWVRVNTLKADVEQVAQQLERELREKLGKAGNAGDDGPLVTRDPLVSELLAAPPGTDLHDHALVTRGSVLLQSKASCLPAAALDPQPGWTVVDCCAAPGNKTTQLAARMGNKGRIIAYDKDPKRLARLKANAALTGASCISARLADFLSIDPTAPEFAQVRGVLLDPSCSGSGTTFTRMDHLLPSHRAAVQPRHSEPTAAGTATGAASARPDAATPAPASGPDGKPKAKRKGKAGPAEPAEPGSGGDGAAAANPGQDPSQIQILDPGLDALDPEEAARVSSLARFQSTALAHALRFPALERLVYSTCSVHVAENEAVVAGALAAAEAAGLELVDPFPSWHRRGLPLFPGAEKLVRTDAYQDGTDGFFVAVFQRRRPRPDGDGDVGGGSAEGSGGDGGGGPGATAGTDRSDARLCKASKRRKTGKRNAAPAVEANANGEEGGGDGGAEDGDGGIAVSAGELSTERQLKGQAAPAVPQGKGKGKRRKGTK